MNKIAIAIDGPAGAGKSTIAKEIANINNLLYIDTGAMYRAATLKLLNSNISFDDKEKIEKILKNTKIEFSNGNIILDDINVNEEIREPRINESVSKVAAMPFIREILVSLQRGIAKDNNVIMDGRDIGTRVLPDAKYKFFLTASIEERAERRYKELIEKGYQCSYEETVDEIAHRDKLDSERTVDPLRKAEDAIIIDTTGKSINEVIDIILNIIRN
ncbi:(d)CMP kinase [Maledivibacter halophilus]|uniref:Cytidylate kinase n=1 Tax=Maledivibacter halophilus TaxID=36842 RepID=A0A1T5LAK6_9FIRM|nr:(d)CMP kinase [Maledivibacter halophilus]SKC72983.1 cytidylate kinase [Maledivibacter halophilus]